MAIVRPSGDSAAAIDVPCDSVRRTGAAAGCASVQTPKPRIRADKDSQRARMRISGGLTRDEPRGRRDYRRGGRLVSWSRP